MDEPSEDLPLLFDKWVPEDFKDLSRRADVNSPGGLSLWYTFPFATISIQSSDIYYPQHEISAELTNNGARLPLDYIFHSEFEELYRDGRAWMQEKVDQAAFYQPQAAGVNIMDHSHFGRKSRISVYADTSKIAGGHHHVAERDRVVAEVYFSLEQTLQEEFGVVKAEVIPNPVLGPYIRSIGEAKVLELSNGITVFADAVPNSEINSGILDIYFLSDENGTRAAHTAVYEKAGQHINEMDTGNLRLSNGSAAHYGLHSASWKIDLSDVKQLPNLTACTLFTPPHLTLLICLLEESA